MDAVVDAELNSGDSLFDANAGNHFGAPKMVPVNVARAKVLEIVLHFCRPILPESPFAAAASGPTRSCLAGVDVFVKSSYVC
jgi:hypothetical protein